MRSTLALALLLATASLAFVPTADAGGPCLVGDRSCLVGVEIIVCVTDPCDTSKVCVGWGAVCKDV